MGVPMVVRFGPADIGRRVSLRRRLLDAGPGEPGLSDVVGVLERWSGGSVSVRRRTGEVVEVPLLAVVAGRVVAPEISAEDLGRRADDTWRPNEREALGEWILRAHGGVTHRPNSALAAGDPGMPVAATTAAVRAWYSERGLTPNVMAPVASPTAAAYLALGWREDSRTLVMSAALADVAARAAIPVGVDAEVTVDLPDDWGQVVERLRDPDVAPRFRELLTATPATRFATVRDSSGVPLAVARGAISEGWLNVTSVEVTPAERGRRLAVALIAAIAGWATEERATHAFLQMWPDNTSAMRLYTRLGFTPHHEYAYYVDPEASSS